MRDFTLKIYEVLLKTFQEKGYCFITFEEYCSLYNGREQEFEVGRNQGSKKERYFDFAQHRGSDLSDFDHSIFTSPITDYRLPITDRRSPITDHLAHFVILRHDADALPLNSLRLALLEKSLSIRGTYYFRNEPNGFNEDIIRQIAGLGHEIGYHYETVEQVLMQQHTRGSMQSASAFQKIKTLWHTVHNTLLHCTTGKKHPLEKQIIDHAYQLFKVNLMKIRHLAPISTICMHGSPLSRYDNRVIWEKYDYHSLDVIGDPYFDIDFNKIAYLTDTGRRWNGAGMSIRDKVLLKGLRDLETERLRAYPSLFALKNTDNRISKHSGDPDQSGPNTEYPEPRVLSTVPYRRTRDIIQSIRDSTFPAQAMITIHPQRWTDAYLPWIKELVWQNLKNQIKWLLVKEILPLRSRVAK